MGFPFRGPAPAANAEDQVGILGTLLDWASTFNAALNPVQSIMAATKTLPGISRFATVAEAAAGTVDNVAVTPLQLASNALPSFTVAATGAPQTWTRLATINGVDAATGGRVDLLIDGFGANSGLSSGSCLLQVEQYGSNGIRGRYTWLSGDARAGVFYTKAISAFVFEVWMLVGPNNPPMRVSALNATNVTAYNDSSVTTLPSGLVTLSPLETDWSFASGVQTWDSGFITDVRRKPGGFIHVRIGAKKTAGGAWAAGDVILTFGSTLRPDTGASFSNPIVNGYSSSAGWNGGSVALTVEGSTGNLKLNGPPANITGLFGEFEFPQAGA